MFLTGVGMRPDLLSRRNGVHVHGAVARIDHGQHLLRVRVDHPEILFRSAGNVDNIIPR